MSPRMTNPSLVVPGALPPLLELTKAVGRTGVPQPTLDFVRLRVSQINGRPIRIPASDDPGTPGGRLPQVAGWRDASCFDGAERAALALAEAATRLSDRPDPVPDDVWEDASRHYGAEQLGAVVLQIGLVNLWNRLNVATDEEPAQLT